MTSTALAPKLSNRRLAPRTTCALNPVEPPARTGTWVPLAAAALCVLPFLPLLAPDGRAIPEHTWCDYVSFQLPIRIFARDEMLAGRFPLWCPYIGCGAPLHASEQASLCYPFITPLVVACGADYGLKLSLFLHIAIGFFGAYLLARQLRLSPVAGSFAALIHAWSAFPICHLMAGHVTIVVQYALAPWALLVLGFLLERPGSLPAVFLAIVMSCCLLAGQPQIFYYIALFLALWASGSLCIGAASAHRARCVAWGALAVLLSAAISGVQLLPTLELVRDGFDQTQRGALEYASGYALDGGDVLRLFLPNAFGNPFIGLASYIPGEHYHERIVYVGLLTPILAILGLLRSSGARWQWGAAWLVVLALAVSLGNNTPLFAALGKTLPGLLLFRCPGRIFCIASLLAALLAGCGLDAVMESQGTRRFRLAVVVLVWAALNVLLYPAAVFLDGFDWRRYAGYASQRLGDELSVTGILAIDGIGVLVCHAVLGARCPRFIVTALIGFCIVDLGYNNVRNFSLAEPTVVNLPAGWEHARNRRFVDAPEYPKLSVGGLQYSKLVPTSIMWHCATVGTNEGGVLPSSTMLLYRHLEKQPSAVLPLASCKYAYVRDKKTWKLIDGALPRVRFVAEQQKNAAPNPPPESTGAAAVPIVDKFSEARVTVTRDEPCRVAIEINAPSPGRLVLADIFYPGWNCLTDGKETHIEKAHGFFRAARLEAGQHTIEFAYEPLSFRIGLGATLFGIVMSTALVAGTLFRR